MARFVVRRLLVMIVLLFVISVITFVLFILVLPSGNPAALIAGRLGPDAIALAAGWPDEPSRAMAAARSLVEDGLAVAGPDGSFRLP